MNFIIGGNSQGKLEFALTLLSENTSAISAADTVADGAVIAWADAFSRPVLDRLHLLIKRLVDHGIDPYEFVERGLAANPSITVICDELSTGVIPIAKQDRQLQETVGRIQCLIAGRARNVYRVYCGIPVLIK